MLGGGNPVGGVGGTSTNFQTLGDRIFGYSGAITTNDSSFTTLFKDRIPQGAAYLLKCYSDIASNAGYTLYIEINDERVGTFFVNGDESFPSTTPFELLVSSDDQVHIFAFAASGTPTQFVRIVGEMIK